MTIKEQADLIVKSLQEDDSLNDIDILTGYIEEELLKAFHLGKEAGSDTMER